MTQTPPANPLDNKEAIAQLNRAMSFLVENLIRPNAQAIQANAQLIESNARAIEATNTGIRELKASVELLTSSTDDSAGEVLSIEAVAIVNEHRFELLLAEARSDRTEWREAVAAQKAQADADRTQWQANFDAQQEVLQRLLLEIRSTNGEVKQLGDRITDLEAG